MNDRLDFVIITALAEERDALLSKLPERRLVTPSDEDVRLYYAAEVSVSGERGAHGSYSVVVLGLLGKGRIEACAPVSIPARRTSR
jgi:hypothetical protein